MAPFFIEHLLLCLAVVLLIITIFMTKNFIKKSKIKDKLHQEEVAKIKAYYLHELDTSSLLISLLTSMYEYSMSSPFSVEMRDIYNKILDNTCKLMKTDSASLMIYDRKEDVLKIAAAVGLSDEIIEKTRLRLGEGISGMVAKEGKPIFVEDIERDPRVLKTSGKQYSIKSFISVPLQIKDRLIGVLNVAAKSVQREFLETDLRYVLTLAEQAAIIIENISLYEELQKSHLVLVQTLIRAINAKDSYTHDHALRSVRYAYEIAQRMGLPQRLIREIEYAALVHDIGKIGISESVLRKTDKLTPEEILVIREHPIIGSNILAPIPFFSEVAKIVRHHHEWYNGQGYPDNLSGNEIPLGARIIAIIDAYDAMSSDRPYRKALSKEVIIEEIKKGKGTQFDPQIADIFLQILQSQ